MRNAPKISEINLICSWQPTCPYLHNTYVHEVQECKSHLKYFLGIGHDRYNKIRNFMLILIWLSLWGQNAPKVQSKTLFISCVIGNSVLFEFWESVRSSSGFERNLKIF